jgi:hypothetical protein
MAIPTVFAGVQFRSRLEARWAAFFELLKWPWDYEPIDLAGYIPDFLIRAPVPFIVEVKGHTEEVAGALAKIERSRWEGDALVVTDNLFDAGTQTCWPGEQSRNALGVGTTAYGEAFFLCCRECGLSDVTGVGTAAGLAFQSTETRRYLCAMCEAGDGVPVDRRGWAHKSKIVVRPELLWREAGNQTQWRSPRVRR